MYELEATQNWRCKKILSDAEAARVIQDFPEEDPVMSAHEFHGGEVTPRKGNWWSKQARFLKEYFAQLRTTWNV